MKMQRSLTFMICSLVLTIVLSACSVIDTGPIVAKSAIEGTLAVGKTLMTQYQPDQMNADASGAINDPRFRARMFIGAGTLVDLLLSLEGGDLAFDVNSSGHGVEVDRQVAIDALAIMGNTVLTDNEKQVALQKLFSDALKSGAVGAQGKEGGAQNGADG